MKRVVAVLVGVLLPALFATHDAAAAQRLRASAKYFYVVPEAVQDEWAYAKAPCAEISARLRRDLHGCIAFEKHQMCRSSKSVELTNVLNDEKRQFMLLHHVFSTKSACVKSRNESLKSH